MSYCAYIHTANKLEPKELFKCLADRGEQVVVVSDKYPCLRFGTFKYALRGIEVNEDNDGYEVRICSMSSMADYQLLPKVVCAVQDLTGGQVFGEDDDEKPIKDPKKYFGLRWRREQTEMSWRIICALVRDENEPIIMNGLFAPFAIGKNILNFYNIDVNNPTGGEDYKRLEYLLFTNQWKLKDLIPTGTDLVLQNPNNKEQYLRLSLISSKDERVCNFDYIRYADLICIMNQDTGDFAMARFKYLCSILPADKFQPIDELQFIKTAEITLKDFDEMLENARTYQEDDFFAEALRKGFFFKGDVQYISANGHQLAIPEEFVNPKGVADIFGEKAPDYLLYNDNFSLLLCIQPCIMDDTIADRYTSLKDARKIMKDNMGMIELEDGLTKGSKRYCYSITKSNEDKYVIYYLSMLVQSGNDIVRIVCSGNEIGMTGQRDTIVFELEHRNNNIRFDNDRVIGWNRDPYDESITTGFLMNLSEQQKYDSMFPTHPLSLLRELVKFIIEMN
ncbi:MAG: hypothetical protein IJ776_05505 [Paludibacteraceae bacterium]|nr:hypothetical protein [Paludibacteraceae bacterium]